VENISLVVASDDRPNSVSLNLRSLTDGDTQALKGMLDDQSVRRAMGWSDSEHRGAAQMIATAQAQERPHYRYHYTFGIVPDDVATVVGVAIVTVGQAEPVQFPPVWQTDLTIFFAKTSVGWATDAGP
jgi:hypothetical protein